MRHQQLRQAVRQSWAVAAALVLVCVAVFAGMAAQRDRPYHSSLTLNVQAPAGATGATTNAVAFSVPTIQRLLLSQRLHDMAVTETRTYAGTFSVAVSATPASGLLQVTTSSLNEALVVPADNALFRSIQAYPALLSLPVVVAELQAPIGPVRDSPAGAIVAAALAGLVLGLVLAAIAVAGLTARRRSRDPLGRSLDAHRVKTLIVLPEPMQPGAGREDEFVLLAAEVRAAVRRNTTSFAVVSPRNSTARSVVAAQLARGLAVAGHRVLLVDADLRTPRLESALSSIGASPTAPFTGMSWLPTEVTNVPNLVMLRNSSLAVVVRHLGMEPTGPVRTVAGSIASLVTETQNANVILIVDCPAIEGAAEANAVISAVDAALVVTSGPPRRRDAEKLLRLTELIGRLGTDILGLVAGPEQEYSLRPVPPQPQQQPRLTLDLDAPRPRIEEFPVRPLS